MINKLNKFYCGVAFKFKDDFINLVNTYAKTKALNIKPRFDKANECWYILSDNSVDISFSDLEELNSYAPEPFKQNNSVMVDCYDIEQFFVKNMQLNGFMVDSLKPSRDIKHWHRCCLRGEKVKNAAYSYVTNSNGTKVLLCKNFKSEDPNNLFKLTTKDYFKNKKENHDNNTNNNTLCNDTNCTVIDFIKNKAHILNENLLYAIKMEKVDAKKRVALLQLIKKLFNLKKLVLADKIENNASALNNYFANKGIFKTNKIYIALSDIRNPIDNTFICSKHSFIIPIFHVVSRELINIQIISPKADVPKLFLKGYKKDCGCLLINPYDDYTELAPNSPVVLCEGYATAISVYNNIDKIVAGLTVKPYVLSCFDCHNMVKVANALKEQQGLNHIIICADNDHETEKKGKGNAGLNAAEHISKIIPNTLIYAPPSIDGCSDWNDYFKLTTTKGI